LFDATNAWEGAASAGCEPRHPLALLRQICDTRKPPKVRQQLTSHSPDLHFTPS